MVFPKIFPRIKELLASGAKEEGDFSVSSQENDRYYYSAANSHIWLGAQHQPTFSPVVPARKLKLLSYNIQAGISTNKYRDYLTHSWKHLLPCPERLDNLRSISAFTSEFDVVGLQEVDGGSLRSGFINQTEYLAERANFPHWHGQTNRDFGKFAQHSIGLLSRIQPSEIIEHKLPGMIPGRGALSARFGQGDDALLVLIVHLALGRRARLRQLRYVSELISDERHVVLMGDLNCRVESIEMSWLLENTSLCQPLDGLNTFPSWRPLHNIDHILVSPSLQVENVRVLDYAFSDHLPIAMEVSLPNQLTLPGRLRTSVPAYSSLAVGL